MQTRRVPGCRRSQVELAVEIFRVLADGTCIRLLWALRDAEAVTANDNEAGR